MRKLVGWLAMTTVMAACSDSPAPPPVSPTNPTPQAPTLVRIALTPAEVSFTEPGQTARLSVTAFISDGTTRDVTADAEWEMETPGVVAIDHGVMTARTYGRTVLHPLYQGKTFSGFATVRAADERMVRVTGVVLDQYLRPVPAVRISGTGAADVIDSTDADGRFDLGPAFGAVLVNLSKFGYETTETTVQFGGGPTQIQLRLPENPSPFVERVIEGQGTGAWLAHRIETRAGAPLDVLVESPTCDYRNVQRVASVRLRGNGAPLAEGRPGCLVRVTATMPSDEGQLEVSLSTPGAYRITYRVPR